VVKIDAAQFESYWQPLLAQGPIEVLLFGDFEKADAIAALEKSFGAMAPRAALPVSTAASELRFPAPTAAPLRLTHRGASDQAAAVIAWPTGGGISGFTEGRQLETLAAIFRDRLFEKFRAEQAASYSPDMAANWPLNFNSGGYLMAYTQVNPTNVDRFFAFADTVAADLIANPVSADELQRAVEPIKQAIERAASGNTFWLNQMKGASYNPERFVILGRLYSDFSDVTPAILQALAQRYFIKDKAWKLVVTPQSGDSAVTAAR
jgi:zinc protease